MLIEAETKTRSAAMLYSCLCTAILQPSVVALRAQNKAAAATSYRVRKKRERELIYPAGEGKQVPTVAWMTTAAAGALCITDWGLQEASTARL
jgi:hypothetical protein